MKYSLGKQGEEFARQYVEKQSWKVLKTNYHSRFGEVDIIALDGEEIVFIEVKTRTNDLLGTPEESITKSKFEKMVKTAQKYLIENNMEQREYRFDALCLRKSGKDFKIEHFQNIYVE